MPILMTPKHLRLSPSATRPTVVLPYAHSPTPSLRPVPPFHSPSINPRVRRLRNKTSRLRAPAFCLPGVLRSHFSRAVEAPGLREDSLLSLSIATCRILSAPAMKRNRPLLHYFSVKSRKCPGFSTLGDLPRSSCAPAGASEPALNWLGCASPLPRGPFRQGVV